MLALAMQFSRISLRPTGAKTGTGVRAYKRQLRPSIRRAVVVGHASEGAPSELNSVPALPAARGATDTKTNDRLGVRLLRKEVIQPHLPVRLPCYDFTPIANPTFDGSLLAVRPPASGVANFRGVTGGVYKTRERIHRVVLIHDY